LFLYATTSPYRITDRHHRGVEYDVDASPNAAQAWQARFQLVDDALLSQLETVEVFGSGCSVTHRLKGQSGNVSYQVLWLPAWQLPVQISSRSRSHYSVWRLESIDFDVRKISQQAQQRAGYLMTDFADIGDNESDPFFKSMINSGYIAYSANASHQGHSHGLPLR